MLIDVASIMEGPKIIPTTHRLAVSNHWDHFLARIRHFNARHPRGASENSEFNSEFSFPCSPNAYQSVLYSYPVQLDTQLLI